MGCDLLGGQMVERITARIAFHPKFKNIKFKSQPHFAATISMGGAAYGVRVQLIEIFTNKSPMVADWECKKICVTSSINVG